MNIQDVYPKHFYQIYSEKHKISGAVGSCVYVDKESDVIELAVPYSKKNVFVSAKDIEPILNRTENTIYQKAIEKFGEKSQKEMMLEEMNELSHAILRESRGRESNVSEEIADVQIMLDQMKLLYPEWISWEQVKLKRLEERL